MEKGEFGDAGGEDGNGDEDAEGEVGGLMERRVDREGGQMC